ncbi:MAG: hypothetical protein C5B52_11385 [Bacteroidetes bacterium]|nr:MAG: hypothetical protein C5B52_11385 [Bacteroidota bacterium]
MTSFIQKLMLGQTNNILGIFFLCGLFAYFVDYKVLQKESRYKREAAFSKIISFAFIYGSITVFTLLKIFDWMM